MINLLLLRHVNIHTAESKYVTCKHIQERIPIPGPFEIESSSAHTILNVQSLNVHSYFIPHIGLYIISGVLELGFYSYRDIIRILALRRFIAVSLDYYYYYYCYISPTYLPEASPSSSSRPTLLPLVKGKVNSWGESSYPLCIVGLHC